MTSKEILNYLDATKFRATRDDLKLGVELVDGPKIAIDCGCGAGSDIAFLRDKGFTVHAFDIEPEAVARCQKRFSGDEKVTLCQARFSTFDYPRASLVGADASLFFCPEREFDEVWKKITDAILPGGLFVGSFLGPEDTMAGPGYDKDAFWPEVLVADERRVRRWLERFEIVSFTEHKSSGVTVTGTRHDWHIFAVVARKNHC
ncbi:class I SAM-dependent methyltransferase [Proteobacteria bacterium 005FR1]|nr:class I SAM-dependent methyltransferase [Proteobacteria bacterium 005FR1]